MILFTIAYFLLHWPLYSVLHILFLEAATENYSLKLNKISLKVAGYKPATFLKLIPSQVIFTDFLLANICLGEDVLKTCWRCHKRNIFFVFQAVFQDIFMTCFQEVFFKTSWRRRLAKTPWIRFWKMRNCYAEDVFKTSWKTRNVCWVSYKLPHIIFLEFRNICFQGVILLARAAS